MKVQLPASQVIVIAESNLKDLDQLSEILSNEGYSVHRVLKGEDVPETVRINKADLVILDTNTDIGGFEVCSKLKNIQGAEDIPVIFVNSLSDNGIKSRAFKAGAVDYIEKPFDKSEILSRIHTHLLIHYTQNILELRNRELHTAQKELLKLNGELSKKFELRNQELNISVKALSTSESLLRSVADNIPNTLLWIFNRSLKVIFASGPGFDGQDPDSYLGKEISDIYGANSCQVMDILKESFQGKEASLEITEESRCLMLRSVPVKEDDGIIIHVLLAAENITKRKQTLLEMETLKNYLTSVFNSMPSVLIGIDHQCCITRWNTKAENVTGIKEQFVIGKSLFDCYKFQISEKEKIMHALKQGTLLHYTHKKNETENKSHYDDFTLFPLKGQEKPCAVIRIDDITEKINLQELMIQNEKILSLGGLMAGLAHEIKSPLTGIVQTTAVLINRLLTRVDMAANQRAAEETGLSLNSLREFMVIRGVEDMIVSIQKSGRLISGIVDNMLSFSKQSYEKKLLYNLEQIIDRTLELAATEYSQRNHYDFSKIEIQKDFQEDMPLLLCEETKIQQVVLSLIRNCAQSMFQAQVKAPLLTLKTYLDNNYICLEIKDNGPGMDKFKQKKIFEPFYSSGKRGEGLDLSLSYFIVTENHKGQLWVDSLPGYGTRFIMRLPRMSEE